MPEVPAMMCKTILGLAGLIIGAFFGGAGDVMMTLVFPHGGWEHVSPDERIRLLTWTIVGAAIGVGVGAVFDTGLRKESTRHLYGGVLLGLSAFWGFVSSFVLIDVAPFWLNALSTAPYFIFAAFVMSLKSTGRKLWLAVSPTFAFSVWLNFYVYPFWLHGTVRYFSSQSRLRADDRHHAGMIDSSSVWVVLLWPCIGVVVAFVSAVLWTFNQRRLDHSSCVSRDKRTEISDHVY